MSTQAQDLPSPAPGHDANPELASASNVAPAAASEAVREGVPVTVNTSDTADRIRKADERNRDAVLNLVDKNVEATQAVLARLRREGLDMKSRGRARFNEAYDAVRTRESELRRNLRDARHALPDAVAATQGQLADSYISYAQAVRQIELSIRGSKPPQAAAGAD